jgi:hypothetical protein
MKNINLKTALYLVLGISIGSLFIVLRIQGDGGFSFWAVLKAIPKVVTIDLLLIALFSSFLWKWRIFRNWLVPFPNLNGTWKGAIQTTWVDPVTGNRPAPIPAILTIRQTFFKISCVMRTGEMTSRCINSDFIIDKEKQLTRLIYSYDSNPIATVRDRSPQHMGIMVFDILEDTVKKMVGEYWTGRKTTGHIEMTFWKKKRLEQYPTQLGTHPVSQARE